jgi:hypothetical protein
MCYSIRVNKKGIYRMANTESVRLLTTEIANFILSSNCSLTPLEKSLLRALKSTMEVHTTLLNKSYEVDMQAKIKELSDELLSIAERLPDPVNKMVYKLFFKLNEISWLVPKYPSNIDPAKILKERFPSAFSGQEGKKGKRETMFA